jgi:O-antigen/teichoic acid export membrane protein
VFDKFFASFSILCLIAFMSIILYFVDAWDLRIISVTVLLMALFDFYLLAFRNHKDNS